MSNQTDDTQQIKTEIVKALESDSELVLSLTDELVKRGLDLQKQVRAATDIARTQQLSSSIKNDF